MSVASTMLLQVRVSGAECEMTDELERTSKEIYALIEVLNRNISGGAEENHEIPRHIWCLG
jgi:hypothetical protein